MSALRDAADRLANRIPLEPGDRELLAEAARQQTDTEVVDELVHFVRTPEWSVSMLEDIADLVHEVRDVGPDYEPDDPQAWGSH